MFPQSVRIEKGDQSRAGKKWWTFFVRLGHTPAPAKRTMGFAWIEWAVWQKNDSYKKLKAFFKKSSW